jgi:hypothetical protein
MNRRLAELEIRRALLLERATRERADVDRTLQLWAPPLALIDRCIGVVGYVVSRPPLLAGAAFVLALVRPRRAFKWARRGFALWQGYRWLSKKIAV